MYSTSHPEFHCAGVPLIAGVSIDFHTAWVLLRLLAQCKNQDVVDEGLRRLLETTWVRVLFCKRLNQEGFI